MVNTTAGFRASGNPDFALAICPGGATAAAMFTCEQVVAAPITIGRWHITDTGGRVSVSAIISVAAHSTYFCSDRVLCAWPRRPALSTRCTPHPPHAFTEHSCGESQRRRRSPETMRIRI